MKRILPLVLLAPTLIAGPPVGAAPPAAPTCLGKTATLVGAVGRSVAGTSGDDVIVSNGAFAVYAGRGDDTICVTGDTGEPDGYVLVQGGRGADDVRVRTRRHIDTSIGLGPGADTLVGSLGDDQVSAGGSPSSDPPTPDVDRDVIATRAGRDVVTAGSADVPLTDAISSATGRLDVVLAGRGLGEDGSLDFGRGGGTLRVDGHGGEAASVDVPHRRMSVGGAGWRWSGRPTEFVLLAAATVDFEGSAADEVLRTDGAIGGVAMAGGDEVLELGRYFADPMTGAPSYDGGPGRDRLELIVGQTGPAAADLAAGFLDLPAGADLAMPSVEDLRLTAEHVVVRGSDGPNSIGASGCTVDVRGMGGPDRISTFVDTDGFDPYFPETDDCRYDAVVHAGPGADRVDTARGDDRIRGGTGPDRLDGHDGDDVVYGGVGSDRVSGGQGRDRGAGERVTRCER